MKPGFVSVLFFWVGISLPATGQQPRQGPAPVTLAEAIVSGLALHPQLQIQRAQTANYEGARRVAAGDFDLTLTSSIFQTHSGNPQTALLSEELFGSLTPQSLVGDTTTYQLQATKLFRDGISITPTADFTRATDNATQQVGVNASQANFQITFPLLRGRGQEVVTAKERGAGMDYDAALLDMNQTVANLVLAIAQDYWGLGAAKKRLRVAVDSEARGRSLVEVTQALIDANQLPRIEMDNAAANLADRVSQRVAADASLVAAREQLALSAGIPGPDVARGLDTTDEFPVGAEVEAPPEGSHAVGEWLDNARRYRADMLAAAKRVEAANTRRIAASDQLRPSLGLVGVVGYNGLRQGRTIWQYLGSPFPAAAGLNASVGLQYTFAPANDVAKGQLEMANSAISSAKAQLDDLERSVRSSIIVSVENLRSSVLRLRTTGETVDSYRMALDGEREKLKLGVSSLTDVVLAEDRLNTALLAQVDAQVTYSQGIAQMRFAIGALVPATGPIQSVNVNLLRTVPGSMQAGDN